MITKTVQFQSKNIAYQVCGKGPAIVLLHGFLESKAIWNNFSDKLQHEFTIIAIDLPGHGDSDQIADSHTMQLMAETIKEVLAVENIKLAIIVGHSMGGYVALQFAANCENMLKGLILFHSHADSDSEATKENRVRTINIVQQNKTGFIMQFIPELFDQTHVDKYSEEILGLQKIASTMTPKAIVAALSGMRDRNNQFQFLSSSKIPVLFIIGKQDSRMPFKQILSQTELPAQSEILLLDNVGHMGFIEAPIVTLSALRHYALRCFE